MTTVLTYTLNCILTNSLTNQYTALESYSLTSLLITGILTNPINTGVV